MQHRIIIQTCYPIGKFERSINERFSLFPLALCHHPVVWITVVNMMDQFASNIRLDFIQIDFADIQTQLTSMSDILEYIKTNTNSITTASISSRSTVQLRRESCKSIIRSLL